MAGENYGQGSSREHAALCPSYLGVRMVLAKSFARIHQDNLVNYGILPLTFAGADDADEVGDADGYGAVEQGHVLTLDGARTQIAEGATRITVTNETLGTPIRVNVDLSARQRRILLAGGLLRHVGEEGTKGHRK